MQYQCHHYLQGINGRSDSRNMYPTEQLPVLDAKEKTSAAVRDSIAGEGALGWRIVLI